MIRSAVTFAVLMAGALVARPAAAQTATPAPVPTPLAGFSARGTLAAEAIVSGNPATLSAEVAVMSAKGRVRLDLLHLDSEKGSFVSVMIGSLNQNGGVTLVYDYASKKMTVWSVANRSYFQSKWQSLAPHRVAAQPAASPLDQILGFTKSGTEYDSLNQTIALVGHQPVNGHVSSVFHYTMQSQKHGGKMQDLTGDFALADDLSGVPVRFWATMKGAQEGSVKLDLVSAQLTPPPASAFAVPPGYKRVSSIMQVMMKH